MEHIPATGLFPECFHTRPLQTIPSDGARMFITHVVRHWCAEDILFHAAQKLVAVCRDTPICVPVWVTNTIRFNQLHPQIIRLSQHRIERQIDKNVPVFQYGAKRQVL